MTADKRTLSDAAKELNLPASEIIDQLKVLDIKIPANPKSTLSKDQFDRLKKKVETVSFIKKIEVKGLWGTHNIIWDMDEKVTILIGENGSGKSTVINLIYALINDTKKISNYHFNEILVFFDNGSILFYKLLSHNASEYITLLNKALESFKPNYYSDDDRNRIVSDFIWKQATRYLKVEDSLKDYRLKVHSARIVNDKTGYRASKNMGSKKIFTQLISTFDAHFKDKDSMRERIKTDRQIKTELDIDLKIINNSFTSYQLNLRKEESKQVVEIESEIQKLSQEESADSQDLQKLRDNIRKINDIREELNKDKNTFSQIINNLFENEDFPELNKILDFDQNNHIIFKKSNEQTVRLDQISSGEKQVILILLTVLLQENKPTILLLDEPEISMHLKWQIQLIDYIQILNPNLQLIVATHAPGIIEKMKWREKTVQISQLFKKI